MADRELPPEALAVIERNAASDIIILEGRGRLTADELSRYELAVAIVAWTDCKRAEWAK
jgi:hypothetical protein